MQALALLALALASSPDGLKGTVKELQSAVSGLKTDVKEIKEALGIKEDKCKCKTLPQAVKRTKVGGPNDVDEVTTADGTQLPETYGAQCKEHDLTTAGCDGEYKAAYCYEAWCYVDEDCEAKDTKRSFYFGKGEGEPALYYSYQNCGGLDAFAAEACGAETKEGGCTELSDNCAWNKGAGSCQNKLCQCTGDNLKLDTEKLGFEDGYGETCSAWDESSCEAYKEKDGTELGLWCCKSWCYVPEECPSASSSAVGPGLFYSYFACPDDADALGQCQWDEPINFDGSPVALSSGAASALNTAAKSAAFLRKMRKHGKALRGKPRVAVKTVTPVRAAGA